MGVFRQLQVYSQKARKTQDYLEWIAQRFKTGNGKSSQRPTALEVAKEFDVVFLQLEYDLPRYTYCFYILLEGMRGRHSRRTMDTLNELDDLVMFTSRKLGSLVKQQPGDDTKEAPLWREKEAARLHLVARPSQQLKPYLELLAASPDEDTFDKQIKQLEIERNEEIQPVRRKKKKAVDVDGPDKHLAP